jgi:Recombinase
MAARLETRPRGGGTTVRFRTASSHERALQAGINELETSYVSALPVLNSPASTGRPVADQLIDTCEGAVRRMPKIERIREVVTGSVDLEYMKTKTEAGWKLVALEWRREIEGDEKQEAVMVEEIPYGLRVASDCSRLEEDPDERGVLIQMMELIVQDYSVSLVAAELNKKGLRTRSGAYWTPVSVFNMLPRLIEVGPRIFSSDEWEARRDRLLRMV